MVLAELRKSLVLRPAALSQGFPWEGLPGTTWTIKRVSEAPDRHGESNQLSVALESYSGTAIQRRRRVDQNCKGCQTIPLGR